MLATISWHRACAMPPLRPVLLLGLAAILPARAMSQDSPYLGMSLEDLMQIEVTTITRRAQSLHQTAAAVYVLTAEDIQASSALTVPDLLRTVPGLEVAQLDANKWAVTARGFNSRISSKMLLVIDGRSAYLPTFGGVFWEIEDLMLENIERIEIIRGPGATIWGSNAVNGVISITTRPAAETTGTLLSATGGNQFSHVAALRHGGSIGAGMDYRFYVKSKEHRGFAAVGGGAAHDGWDSHQAGFRVDSGAGQNDSFTLQGDVYRQSLDQRLELLYRPGQVQMQVDDAIEQEGLNLIGRWTRRAADGAEFSTRFYYDYKNKQELIQPERISTYDLDFSYVNAARGRHQLTLGAGIRYIRHEAHVTDYLLLTPESESLDFVNLSLFDDIRVSDSTILGLGLKLERNPYTGLEYQPSIRLNQALGDSQSMWLAVSRSVRIPSRGERDTSTVLSYIPAELNPLAPFDTYAIKQPSPEFGTEKLLSYEAGWRLHNSEKLSIDLAGYYNEYRDLRSTFPGTPYCSPDPRCVPPVSYLVQPITVVNLAEADTRGVEAVVKWQPAAALSVEFVYSVVDIDYRDRFLSAIREQDGLTPARDEPLHKFNVQADLQLSPAMSLSAVLRHVSEPGIDNIGEYSVMDMKYRWQIRENIELAVAARNLGRPAHREFSTDLVNSANALIEQDYYLNIAWQW